MGIKRSERALTPAKLRSKSKKLGDLRWCQKLGTSGGEKKRYRGKSDSVCSGTVTEGWGCPQGSHMREVELDQSFATRLGVGTVFRAAGMEWAWLRDGSGHWCVLQTQASWPEHGLHMETEGNRAREVG